MALSWTSVHAVLCIIMCSFTNVRATPCAEAHTPSAVVPIGSSVSAFCTIKEDCSLTKSREFRVEWPYNANLSYKVVTNQDKTVHEVLIFNLTHTTIMLQCAICVHEDCNVVAGVQIKAAYPPPAPQNLTCLLNLSEPCSLLCSWDPGQNTLSIPTNYTLHTEIRDSSHERFVYNPAPGRHFYKVPRVGFALFNKVQIQVVAANALGNSTSESLVLDPMETAKLDAPEIQRVGAEKYGCLGHSWSLTKSQKWITKTLSMEIRLIPQISQGLDKEQVILRRARSCNTVEVCSLLHGMIYQSEMRVRYFNSPWSEWSQPTVAMTLMKAPTGRLVTWLKLPGQPVKKQHQAELFWKPSSHFRANSMNVSYIVTVLRTHGKWTTVCDTKQQHCSFQVPINVRKIQLIATNKAGRSSPTEVAVYRQIELDSVPNLTVSPKSEESMLIEWSSPASAHITAYVLEWKPVLETDPAKVYFEIVDKSQLSLVISGLEPYKPYEFSIYPKYKNGIGQSSTVMAYTREKAPSESPVLKFGEIRPSYVELFWEEIPLQQMNGIITGYKVFYWDDKNNIGVVDIDRREKRAVLKDLHAYSIYNIFLMTSTAGGSLNGSIVTLKTPSIDAFEIVLMVIPACVGLTLFCLGMFTCFSSNKWLKKCLWPIIPDPANSSIKKWTTDSVQDLPSFTEAKDPVLVYLSHFSLLSLSEKELWKGDKYINCGKWTYDDESINEEHSDSGIYNSGSQSESVPYATVVFENPYCTQPAQPPAYLRSESTQPLLSEEEPSSPQPYEKSTFQKVNSKDEKGSIWEDFPMLKSLEMTNIPDQA